MIHRKGAYEIFRGDAGPFYEHAVEVRLAEPGPASANGKSAAAGELECLAAETDETNVGERC